MQCDCSCNIHMIVTICALGFQGLACNPYMWFNNLHWFFVQYCNTYIELTKSLLVFWACCQYPHKHEMLSHFLVARAIFTYECKICIHNEKTWNVESFFGGLCNTHIWVQDMHPQWKNMKCWIIFWWLVQYSHMSAKYASTMKKKEKGKT